jgi:hypothetical protein
MTVFIALICCTKILLNWKIVMKTDRLLESLIVDLISSMNDTKEMIRMSGEFGCILQGLPNMGYIKVVYSNAKSFICYFI